MKAIRWLICIVLIASFLSAQVSNEDESPIDKIKQLDANMLKAYTDPLMTAIGVALGTGFFHSAYSHDVFGFDIGLRYMRIGIPASARYFNGKAVACSLANGDLVYYEVDVDSISTIFGPGEATWVQTTGNAIAIPPVFPGGFDVTSLPFVMPQINVGLPIGLELAFGYLPLAFTFPLNIKSNLYFLRLGGKLSINKVPLLNRISFPCAIAIGGFYQRARLASESGRSRITLTMWNLRFLASKRFETKYIVDFEPFLSAGIERTKFNFHYDFKYTIPDTINDIPEDRIEVIKEIDTDFYSKNQYRAVIGITLYVGRIYFHYDYNIVTYKAHNIMLGITIR